MLITNKRVPKLSSLASPHNHTDLIIIDQSLLVKYFGPTVAIFADLIAFDEATDLMEK